MRQVMGPIPTQDNEIFNIFIFIALVTRQQPKVPVLNINYTKIILRVHSSLNKNLFPRKSDVSHFGSAINPVLFKMYKNREYQR